MTMLWSTCLLQHGQPPHTWGHNVSVISLCLDLLWMGVKMAPWEQAVSAPCPGLPQEVLNGWSHLSVSLPVNLTEGSAGTVSQALVFLLHEAQGSSVMVAGSQGCVLKGNIQTAWFPREPDGSCMPFSTMCWKSHSITSSVICRPRQSWACPNLKGGDRDLASAWEESQRIWGHLLRLWML